MSAEISCVVEIRRYIFHIKQGPSNQVLEFVIAKAENPIQIGISASTALQIRDLGLNFQKLSHNS